MSPLDLAIVFAYIAFLFVFGIIVGLKETAEDFLVVGRKAKPFFVVFSVVSTVIGVFSVLGVASAGYETGISLGLLMGLGTSLGIFIVAMFSDRIKDFGDRFKAHTLGDFFGIRYSLGNRYLLASVILIAYFLFLAGQFIGAAALLRVWSGFSFEAAVLIAGFSMVIYTAFAGIKSDFYTDVIHFWVIAISLVLVSITVFLKSGGMAIFSSLPPGFLSPTAFFGSGLLSVVYFVFGILFGSSLYLCSMEFWQRIYASSSKDEAKKAMLLSAVLVLPFYLLAAFLGIASRAAIPGIADPDLALFKLMELYLPAGLLGLGIAGFLAALISTANTMLMVASATAVKDFYKTGINPEASQKKILFAARLLTFFIGIGGMATAFFFRNLVDTMIASASILLVISPAIIGGFFWKKATAKASFISILLGIAISVGAIPFIGMRFAFLPGFVVSLLAFIMISIITKHSSHENMLMNE